VSHFAPVPIDAARYMLQHTTHAQKPCKAVMLMEMSTVVITGDTRNWSVRNWMKRWKCGTSTVYKVAAELLEHFVRSSGTGAEHYARTILEAFPRLGADPGTKRERRRNDVGTPRASSSKKKEEDLRIRKARDEQDKAQDEQPDPEPRQVRTHRELQGTAAEVWAVWDEQHRAVTGQPARSNQFVGQDAADLVGELQAEGIGPSGLARGMAAFLRASQAGEGWALRRGGEACCFGRYRAKRPQAELRVAPAPAEPTGPPAEVVALPEPERPPVPDDLERLDPLLLDQLAAELDPQTHEVFLKPCRRSASDPGVLWAPNEHLGAVLWQRAAGQLQAVGIEQIRGCA